MARDLRLGRLVAIKHLRAASRDLDRCLEEARTTARCSHENIIVIYEVGEHDGHPYMVLEHLDGQTLRQWLRERATSAGQHTPVGLARAMELITPVVRALAYAHTHGVVHRDLKPENVMITRAGVVKVLDFGIAKILTAPQSATATDARSAHPQAQPQSNSIAVTSSSLVGTPRYMSPEQLNIGAIDHRTDLWSVGIMLFELLAGYHPVSGAPKLVRVGDVDEPMPSLRDLAPALAAKLGGLVDIIDHCLRKRPEERPPSAQALLAALEALDPGRRAVHVGADGTPFPGLAAFQEADAGRFFGRDRDMTRVVNALRNQPLVTIVGPSGAGKSSLVRAGVIPALKRSEEGWEACIVRPGRAPLSALASLLETMAYDSAPDRQRVPDDGPRSTGEDPIDTDSERVIERIRTQPGYLGAQLRARATRTRRRTLVFIDQLEELYTLGTTATDRAAFLASLLATADDAASPLRVVLTIRTDFIDRLTEFRHLGDAINRGSLLLPPMEREELRQALLQPLEAVDYRFESPALADRMIDALAQTRGALPLLQFTAAQLWERRDCDRRLLTESSYAQLGGVAGALAAHADAVLAGMSSVRQAVTRAVFERLVTPERTRALVGIAELRTLHAHPELVDDLVQHLATMRLVAIERAPEAKDAIVELVHESLIERWPTLTRWLDDNQDDAAMLARLRSAARDWERGGRPAGLLWTGAAALDAHTWQQRYQGPLTRAERDYLAAVRARRERARRVRRRAVAGLLAVVTAIAVVMSWLAWQAKQEAIRARDVTRIAALRTLPHDPTTQLALLREIENTASPPADASHEARRLRHATIASVVFTGHEDGVRAASFSPDGSRIVSASRDKTVQVWNADGSGTPIVLRGHDDVVCSARFSPDGTRIVSTSMDNTIRIWNADGSGTPIILRGHDEAVWSAAFSPDGTRIVSSSRDQTVRVWNADGSGVPLILRGHSATIWSTSFSPDGTRIVSASFDHTVRVWNADGSGEAVVFRGHDDSVWWASFSPDGAYIASASFDNTVQVWRADGSGTPVILRGHDGIVLSVDFSPDGTRIASASYDKTIRIWRADGSGTPLVLRAHDEAVRSVSFSPDGTQLVSASADNTVRVWSSSHQEEPRILRGHNSEVRSASFSPNGDQVVSASRDNTVRLWDPDGNNPPLILRGHNTRVHSASFSSDGAHIVSTSDDNTAQIWRTDGSRQPVVTLNDPDGLNLTSFSPDSAHIAFISGHTVRVWNADGSGSPTVLRGHKGVPHSVKFSPDGAYVVSSSDDKTVRIWRIDGSEPPRVLRGHTEVTRSARFSPDGTRVVSASDDNTVRVWQVDGHGDDLVLRGHDDWVVSAEFSPDGKYIVSASKDRTIRIWHSDGTGDPVVLRGHSQWVNSARFSPDGQRIVSASDDHTVRVWHDLAPATLDDPRLWTKTNYCLPVARRVKLLGVSEERARQNRARCVARVAQARRQAADDQARLQQLPH